MARTFCAQDLVQLPRMNAVETLAVTQEIKTEAAGAANPLPTAISRSLSRLLAARELLQAAVVNRDQNPAVNPQVARMADRGIDNAWGPFHRWTSAWAELDDGETARRDKMRAVHARLFPKGLEFTRLSYKAEWAESDARLKIIDSEAMVPLIESLGGAPFLAHIRKMHAAYGEALHVTSSRPAAAAPTELRERLVSTLDALRDYVSKVMGNSDPEVPGSEQLAAKLLRPIEEWEAKRGKRAAEPSPAPSNPAAAE